MTDAIDDLARVLATNTLDPVFEEYGDFIIRGESGVHGEVLFFGNFLDLSHVFNFYTSDPATIDRLSGLIDANKKTAKYLAAKADRTSDRAREEKETRR